jgi:Copper transport outer membrane protein, MctB
VVHVIDFRYHLVSIVSIFMALAVGIVLGAGPLKGDIGSSLTQQVTALRADKAQLRSDLDVAKRNTSARDTFNSVVAPAIMKDQLTGKTVALLVTPGADADLVKNTTTSLVAAGARVGSTTTLTDAWADPTKRTIRNDLLNGLAASLKVPTGASSPDQVAATVLVSAILAGADHSTPALPSPSTAALDALQAGDLINVTPNQVLASSSVIFLGGPVKGSTPQDASARLAAYVQLVVSIDAGGSGVVVATKSNSADPTLSEDLVAAVRKDSDAVKVASTVDDADLPMGQGTLVLALAQVYAGGLGQYGLAADAKAIVPDITVKK